MNIHRMVAAASALSLIATVALAGFPQRRGPYRYDRRVHLKSTNYRRSSKNVPNRGVRLVRRNSTSPCVLGRSWGYTRNRIWVDRGCEADFAYTPRR